MGNMVIQPIEKGQLTRRSLEERALFDPTIHMALTLVERGDMTLEESLILLALGYSQLFDQMRKADLDRLNTQPWIGREVLVKTP